ncbi:MAG: (4Fe-4S)-binding protein [Chitinophagaceae bacterium]
MAVKTHKYSNKDITIIWKPDTCIHSKICWHGLREVFDPARRPWIIADAADTAKIMEQIDKCPSGALSYIKNESVETLLAETVNAVPQPVANIIECLPNGPLLVNGSIIIKKSDGTEEIKTGTVALCRCGASNNKPYCDGGHSRVGFTG